MNIDMNIVYTLLLMLVAVGASFGVKALFDNGYFSKGRALTTIEFVETILSVAKPWIEDIVSDDEMVDKVYSAIYIVAEYGVDLIELDGRIDKLELLEFAYNEVELCGLVLTEKEKEVIRSIVDTIYLLASRLVQ